MEGHWSTPAMTPRERVAAAIRRLPHDRIPVDLGGTFATALTARACAALRAELGLPPETMRIEHPELMLSQTAPDLRRALGIDTAGVYLAGGALHGWQPWAMADGLRVELPANLDLRQRPDGTWELHQAGQLSAIMPPGSLYFDAVAYAKWRDYDPAALTDAVLEDVARRTRALHNETDLAVVLNMPYTIFNGTSPEFLCALVLEKEEAHARMALWTEHVLECVRLLLNAVGHTVSVMAFSGDAGTQRGPLIGPDLYREMFLPHFRRIPEFLHNHSDIRFFYHTCGSVYRLIPGFIELGVDILNPLQVTADEMEAERLTAEFGDRLVFWGGGIDAQHTLVTGSEDAVRERVRRQVAAYAARPGYVFAFDHNLQPDVPPRNILAALDEVRRFNP